jgi:hypothetical protein
MTGATAKQHCSCPAIICSLCSSAFSLTTGIIQHLLAYTLQDLTVKVELKLGHSLPPLLVGAAAHTEIEGNMYPQATMITHAKRDAGGDGGSGLQRCVCCCEGAGSGPAGKELATADTGKQM